MRKAKTDITPEDTEHPDIAEPKSTRPSRKRKDNPVLIKYETNDPTTNLKIEELEEDKTPEGPAKFDKNNKKNFQHIYDTIREMRKDKTAAVDTYGCHRNADPTAPKDVQNFQTLCSLLISVQNRDESTAAAVERLKKFGLTAEKMAKTSEAEILEVMGGVNFNKKKATFIKSAAEIIMDKYKGKVPETLEEILEFPGVGNKIGILLMAVAHDAVVGIGVDTHVHRISNRLGWAKTKTPDETRLELQSFVPRDDWGDINHWMVGFGQQICLPINPKCQECKLSDICLEGKRNMRYYKGKVKVEETDIKVTKKTKKNKKDDIEVKEEIIEVKQEETGYEPSMVSTQVSEMVTVTFSPQDEEGKGKKKKVQKRKTM